jgi:hypothetical protein
VRDRKPANGTQGSRCVSPFGFSATSRAGYPSRRDRVCACTGRGPDAGARGPSTLVRFTRISRGVPARDLDDVLARSRGRGGARGAPGARWERRGRSPRACHRRPRRQGSPSVGRTPGARRGGLDRGVARARRGVSPRIIARSGPQAHSRPLPSTTLCRSSAAPATGKRLSRFGGTATCSLIWR